MFSIGEFARISGLSVKTLRFYHEKGVLKPCSIDDDSGYRYYDHASAERARVVVQLRDMEFSLDEIREILDHYNDEADILDYLEQQKEVLRDRIKHHRSIVASLDTIISREKEARIVMQKAGFEVEEKVVDTVLMAGVRMRGHYSECGKGFAQIGKSMGRFISGKPFCLYFDDDHPREDADFEACMPISKRKEVEGISVRELPGGKCVALLHRGPYEEIGRSYEAIGAYLNEKGYRLKPPCREIYLKGPGMLFKGNPKNYLTELQFIVEE